MGDILQFLRELCPPSHCHRSMFWHQEQLQELRAGDDGICCGSSSHRPSHAVHVAHHRLPRDVHHHLSLLSCCRSPHTPLPLLSVTKEDSRTIESTSRESISDHRIP